MSRIDKNKLHYKRGASPVLLREDIASRVLDQLHVRTSVPGPMAYSVNGEEVQFTFFDHDLNPQFRTTTPIENARPLLGKYL